MGGGDGDPTMDGSSRSMTPALVLVDGHNLLWRAAFGFPAKVTARDGTDRTAVFVFFALLRAALRELDRLVECIVCFDGQFGATWRQQTDQAYKHNRQTLDLSPLAGLADVQRGLSMLGPDRAGGISSGCATRSSLPASRSGRKPSRCQRLR
jgi:hypothetical protein